MEIIGRFRSDNPHVWFDFAQGVPEWAPDWFAAQGATHTLFLRDTGVRRGAKVLKSVVHVIVDEDENGAVWEKWPIRKRFDY